jgi:hypothetical protein
MGTDNVHRRYAMSHKPFAMMGRSLLVRDHFLGTARGAAEDDTALRRADEVDEVLHFGAGERLVLFDLLKRARGVELRLQQIAE